MTNVSFEKTRIPPKQDIHFFYVFFVGGKVEDYNVLQCFSIG